MQVAVNSVVNPMSRNTQSATIVGFTKDIVVGIKNSILLLSRRILMQKYRVSALFNNGNTENNSTIFKCFTPLQFH